jgi:uncharacterized protein YuzB (UPF0349 family)
MLKVANCAFLDGDLTVAGQFSSNDKIDVMDYGCVNGKCRNVVFPTGILEKVQTEI